MALGASKIQHLRAHAYQAQQAQGKYVVPKSEAQRAFSRRAQFLGQWDLN
jgi:hypothetical protein